MWRQASIAIDLDSVAEARLVAQALGGSEGAFEQIVRRHQRAVLSLLYRLTGDSALAEDLAQESFVKAFRNLSAFDRNRRFSSWLLRIAHNTAIDFMRRQRLPLVHVDADPPESRRDPAAPTAPDPVEQKALGAAIDAAMGRLRPEHRVAVTLRYEEGLAFGDIAEVMGVPEATARSHVHRARKALAAALRATGWGPPALSEPRSAGSKGAPDPAVLRKP